LCQSRSRLARLPHGELLPKRQVLDCQFAVRAHRRPECPKDDPNPGDHDGPMTDHSSIRKTIAADGFSEATAVRPVSLAISRASETIVRLWSTALCFRHAVADSAIMNGSRPLRFGAESLPLLSVGRERAQARERGPARAMVMATGGVNVANDAILPTAQDAAH